ncbi:MAG TPA: alpha/beta hydrolase [Pseudonocardiaceae bacterium]|jgi:dienelactone hydrolase
MTREIIAAAVVGAALLGPHLPADGASPPHTAPAESYAESPAESYAESYAASAAAMQAAGEPYTGWVSAGRRFLAFNQHGDGTVVEVVGDLDTADRIALLVPGVDSTLRDFDRGLGGVARRALAVQARAIYGAARAADPGGRVAVVAWLGYDPPAGLSLDALRERPARQGALKLAQFLARVAARHPAARITVVGHSYGGVVVGLAARSAPPQVTDLVALGAPGMGADRAADLHTGARIWSALAADDWIRHVPQIRLLDLGHGKRPAAASLGAFPLPTEGVAGHDGYLAPGSATLAALAEVVTR